MVNYVMTYIPKTVWGQRWQKSNSTQNLIQFTVWGKALVAGIMTKDEDATSHKTCKQAKYDFQQDAFYKNGASNTAKP